LTARAPGGSSRGADGPTPTTWTRDGVGAILIVLAAALAFRLIIAYAFPGIGLNFDLGSFRGWADDLARNGLHGFYERPGFHDYTPGYLYVLYLVGRLGQAAGGIGDLIKIPAILADVAIGWLVWSMAKELGAGRRTALLAAAIVVVNPVTWFDSVVWGQVDSFGVVFLLLGMRELWRDHPERAAVWTVIAALIKPQLGILIPVVAVVTIRRALWPTPDPADREAEPASGGLLDRLRAWERRTDHPIRIVTTGVVALATALVLSAPFGLSLIELRDGALRSGLLEQIFMTAAGYPYVSVNAYNPWALAQLDGTGLAANGGWICDALIANPVPGGPVCETAFQFGPIPALLVGTALLLTGFAVVCAMIARRPDRLTILVGVTILAIAFFVLPTRVHERYLFPFFALGAILAAVSARWLVAYIALSVATFLNMYVVLTTIYPDAERGMVDWLGIGQAVKSELGVSLIALWTLIAAVWAFLQLRPAAMETLEAELVEGDGEEEAFEEAWEDTPPRRGPTAEGPALQAAGAAGAIASGSPIGAVAAGVSPAEPELPRWSDRPSFVEVGLIEWLKARLNDRPIRADRSRALHGEPAGRLDRLDLWFLVVIIVASLGLRVFRLAEPYQMHFDEVYHARTATEFLQSWRYGISHDIYEWTHPHLAKYAMAGGLVAWGDDRVSATSQLGVPVRDSLVERRRDDPGLPNGRAGDRVHLVTGSELRSYDLQTRELIFTAPVEGAAALTIDPVGQRLFIGAADGRILTFDLYGLDGVTSLETSGLVGGPQAFGQVDGSIRLMFATDDGQTLLVGTDDDRLTALDAASAEPLGTIDLAGIAGFAPGGSGPALTATPGSVEDPVAVAAVLADLLGGDAETYEARLRSTAETTIVAGVGGVDQRANVDAAIADGSLAGLAFETVPRVAVADADGVTFVAAATGDVVSSIRLDGGGHGLAHVTGIDDPKVFVTTGGKADGAPGEVAVITVGGDSAKDGPVLQRTIPLPAKGTRVAYDEASQMVHVLGATPDGAGWTIYVIEPHANAVFADARLPFEPSAWAIDVAKPYPSTDRQQILAFAGDGGVASVEIGKHAFAWRLPGVIAGALMAGLLYLLTRILFRRREVAVLVGIFAIADGMFFVQSRIGMNDAYVGLGIVAAYTLFAAIWTGAWRWRGAFWVAMPVIGVVLGFALASKWVALYSIGALGVLVLARSAIGRFIVIAALIAMTAVLGHLALAVPENTGLGNLPFVAIMVGLTAIAVVANILHPIAWSDDEMRFAVGAPAVLGLAVGLGAIALGVAETAFVVGPVSVTPLHVAAGLAVLGAVVYVAFVVAGRSGFGPLAAPPDPSDPAALLPPPAPPPREAWLRPGALLGLPVAWMIVCLLVIPVGLYVVSYLPWAFVEGHRITADWPPGHTGQTLVDLTRQMYEYHNNLTEGHAASSPWWAWPFDLKPVWFYQEGFAGATTAAVYDAGNLVIWWLGVPALAFVAWQAYARRSLGLALIAIGFACQWVAWARIDRAAFQYHYYTSLPFVVMALAYFAAELWHGTSRRIWLLARVSAAVAVLGPALLWLFDRPLCALVGVERAVPNSQACPPLIPEFVLTAQTLALGVVVCVAILVFLRQLAALDVSRGGEASFRQLVPLGATAAAALGGLLLVRLVPVTPLITLSTIPVEPLVVVLALPLAFLALFVATARDARRFVIGLVTAVFGWFVVLYPNISALPLPSVIANAYQGILPTYLYAFQFPVSRESVATDIKLIDPIPAILAVALILLSIVLAHSAWVWRIAIAERDAEERDAADAASGLAPPVPGS
jgi:Gpi18-like mannosyltransferase